MSFWGAKVITNLFSAVPVFVESIVTWLWGGFTVDNPTLNRFYALHYLIPFIIVAVVILPICALHQFGSNNHLGIYLTVPQTKLPFPPYSTAKFSFCLGFFLIAFAAVEFYLPTRSP